MKTDIRMNGSMVKKPHLIKDGIRIICNTENFVPIVVSGLSSSFFFERYRGMACTRMTRTNQVVFFSPCEELMAPCSRMTRTNRVAWKIEREESMAPAQR